MFWFYMEQFDIIGNFEVQYLHSFKEKGGCCFCWSCFRYSDFFFLHEEWFWYLPEDFICFLGYKSEKY